MYIYFSNRLVTQIYMKPFGYTKFFFVFFKNILIVIRKRGSNLEHYNKSLRWKQGVLFH